MSDLMIVSHEIEIANPTPEQEVYFKKACGVRRFSFNWGLHAWEEQFKQGHKPNWIALKKEFNAIKKEKFPWVFEVTKCAVEGAFADLGTAWSRYFKKKAQRPKFKKKGKSQDSFYLANDQFSISGKEADLPHIGIVKLREALRFEGRVLGATVKRKADRWLIAVQLEVEKAKLNLKPASQTVVGVDLGVLTDVTLSTGKTFKGPQPLKRFLRKLKHLNRSLHRKKLGSQNREKARIKVARIHQKIANIRKDFIHKTTTRIANQFGVICLEDLNTSGMLKNHKLARSISDVSFYEVKRQLEYKAERRGGRPILLDRFFPSSKQCRKCDTKNDTLTLKDRTFLCINSRCKHQEDRDLHSSRCLVKHRTHGRWGNHACGEKTSMTPKSRKRFPGRKSARLKQEQCINSQTQVQGT